MINPLKVLILTLLNRCKSKDMIANLPNVMITLGFNFAIVSCKLGLHNCNSCLVGSLASPFSFVTLQITAYVFQQSLSKSIPIFFNSDFNNLPDFPVNACPFRSSTSVGDSEIINIFFAPSPLTFAFGF